MRVCISSSCSRPSAHGVDRPLPVVARDLGGEFDRSSVLGYRTSTSRGRRANAERRQVKVQRHDCDDHRVRLCQERGNDPGDGCHFLGECVNTLSSGEPPIEDDAELIVVPSLNNIELHDLLRERGVHSAVQ